MLYLFRLQVEYVVAFLGTGLARAVAAPLNQNYRQVRSKTLFACDSVVVVLRQQLPRSAETKLASRVLVVLMIGSACVLPAGCPRGRVAHCATKGATNPLCAVLNIQSKYTRKWADTLPYPNTLTLWQPRLQDRAV